MKSHTKIEYQKGLNSSSLNRVIGTNKNHNIPFEITLMTLNQDLTPLRFLIF